MVVVDFGRCCADPRAGSPPSTLPWLLETGDVYGEFALLGEPLFLHVAMVTDTMIKLSPSLAEETDLSGAIILQGALLSQPQQGHAPHPGPFGAASCPRCSSCIPGSRRHRAHPPAPCWELPAPARPLGAGSTPGHIHSQEHPGQGGRCR